MFISLLVRHLATLTFEDCSQLACTVLHCKVVCDVHALCYLDQGSLVSPILQIEMITYHVQRAEHGL